MFDGSGFTLLGTYGSGVKDGGYLLVSLLIKLNQ